MHAADRSRKEVLVEYGFRLPSALDNRPLKFDEFIKKAPNYLFVSATPNELELELSSAVAEQIIRPTGLLDPVIDIIDSIREYSNFRKNFMVGFFGDALQNIYDSGVGTLSNK